MSVAPGIHLLPANLTDAQALTSLVGENTAQLAAFMPKVVMLGSLNIAEQYLASVMESNGAGELLEWHIFSGQILCGAIRLNHIEADNRKASIGYYLGARHQGAGMATASVRAVLKFAFERLGMNRIELRCGSGNRPSQRLAERLGFSWEGLLRQAELIDGVFLDHFIYSLLRADFEANAAESNKQAA
ncbi:MAG: GNAT family N-acetyltransferase [Massilia sp.]|nr:GNAT family N-acetyltransferase [Massilia sp.]